MEELSKSVNKVQVLLPYIWMTLLITIAVFVVFNILSKRKWKTKNMGRMDIFLGLSIKASVLLACSWIKFVVITLFLCSYIQLQIIHYVFLLFPMLIVCALSGGVKDVAYAASNTLVQILGVFAANLIVNFIIDMGMDFGYYAVYVFFAILNFLYAAYTFIGELKFISKARKLEIK